MQNTIFPENLAMSERLALIVVAVIGAHLVVLAVRWASVRIMRLAAVRKLDKAQSLNSLATSFLVFTLYFVAVGVSLNELGISLTTYLASASVIGLAVGFGSQGIVQDVVTGLTVLLSDLFDVGDMVEISGQTGVVTEIGMRFTVLENPMGARVIIPNRSIANVISYPRGYLRCYVDATLATDAARSEALIRELTSGAVDQFAGILRAPPEITGPIQAKFERAYMRVKFRVWPGRGGPLETAFKQEIVQAMKKIDPDYSDWMVAVSYEVEGKRDARKTLGG